MQNEENREESERKTARNQVIDTYISRVGQEFLAAPSKVGFDHLRSEIERNWPDDDDQPQKQQALEKICRPLFDKISDRQGVAVAEKFLKNHISTFRPEFAREMYDLLDRREKENEAAHLALRDTLPDLALDEQKLLLDGRPANPALSQIYENAEQNWYLPPAQRAEYGRSRQEAQDVRQWLDLPKNSFKPFSSLLEEARSTFPGQAEGKPGLAEKVVQARQQQFEQDPLGYVGQARDRLLRRLEQGHGATIIGPAEKEQLKIALGRKLAAQLDPGNRSAVLSRAEAENYKNVLNGLGQPEARLKKLVELDGLWGRYAGRAFNQIGVRPEEQLAVKLQKTASPEVADLIRLGYKNLGRQADRSQLGAQARWHEAHKSFSKSRAGKLLTERLNWPGADERQWDDWHALLRLSESVALGVGDEVGSRPGLAVSKLLAAAEGSL